MRRSAAALVVVLAILVVSRASGLRAQQWQAPAPSVGEGPILTFRAGVDIVELDVSVLDTQGEPIRGLTAADFTILEDGKPKPVVAFAPVEVPGADMSMAAWTRDVGPDVSDNRLDTKRVVVILIDDFQTGRFRLEQIQPALNIAEAVVHQLGPGDLASVVYDLHRSSGQEFTTDHARLLDAIHRFAPTHVDFVTQCAGLSPAQCSGGGRAAGACNAPSRDNDLNPCIRDAFMEIADTLQGWPGRRKALVFISPGVALNFAKPVAGDLARMVRRMEASNVDVYEYAPGGVGIHHPGSFAEVTGGRAVNGTNEPEDAVPQMFRDMSSYYLLGFPASPPGQPERLHSLAVKVNRPDAEVQTRTGYFPPRPDPAPKVSSVLARETPEERALAGALPSGDLPLSLTVAPMPSTAKAGKVPIAIAAGVGLDPAAAHSQSFAVTAAAFDDDWKLSEEVSTFATVSVSASAPSALVPLRLDLPPGRYEVRVGATNTATKVTGSVYASVTVPDVTKSEISLSGLVLTRASSPAVAPLVDVLPVVPTAARAFATADHVTAFARVYQGGSGRLVPATVTMRIVNEHDATVVEQPQTIDADRFGTGRAADYQVNVPLANLPAGQYLLTVDVGTRVSSASGAKTPVSSLAHRDVRFSVH